MYPKLIFFNLKKDPSKICLSETKALGPLLRMAAGWLAFSVFPTAGLKVTCPLSTDKGAIQELLNDDVSTFVVFCNPLKCQESTQNRSPPFCPVSKILI